MRSTLIALLLPLVAVLGGETECVLFHCASELAQCEIGKKLPQQPRALEASSVPLTTLLHNAAVPNLRTHVTAPPIPLPYNTHRYDLPHLEQLQHQVYFRQRRSSLPGTSIMLCYRAVVCCQPKL